MTNDEEALTRFQSMGSKVVSLQDGRKRVLIDNMVLRQSLELPALAQCLGTDEAGRPALTLDEQWAALEVFWMQTCVMGGRRIHATAIGLGQAFSRELVVRLGQMLQDGLHEPEVQVQSSVSLKHKLDVLAQYAKACAWWVRWLLVDYQVLPQRVADALMLGCKVAGQMQTWPVGEAALNETHRYLKATLVLMAGHGHALMPEEMDQAWTIVWEAAAHCELESLDPDRTPSGAAVLIEPSRVRVVYWAEELSNTRAQQTYFIPMKPLNAAILQQMPVSKSSDESRVCRLLVDQLNGACARPEAGTSHRSRECSVGFRSLILRQTQAIRVYCTTEDPDAWVLEADSAQEHPWTPTQLVGLNLENGPERDLFIITWLQRIGESGVRAGIERLGCDRMTHVVRSRDGVWFNNGMRVTLALFAWSAVMDRGLEGWLVVACKNGEKPKPGMELPKKIDLVGCAQSFERTEEVRYLPDCVAMRIRKRTVF